MKKLITLIAFALMTFTTNAQLIVNGDLNYDGDLNITDVMKMIDIILGNTPNSYLTCPNNNHPHLIDLGLPSGTKWACCNVGADKPEACGGHYAWGETEEDIYHEGGMQDNDIAGTQYDVACVKWGGSWQMPSLACIKELVENCIYEFWSIDDVIGLRFTSKNNGGWIFLPVGNRLYDEGEDKYVYDASVGYYWTSTFCWKDTAYCLMVDTGTDHPFNVFAGWYEGWDANDIRNCYSVRPVWVP